MPKDGCNSVETIPEGMSLQPGESSYPENGTGNSRQPEATSVTSWQALCSRSEMCQVGIVQSVCLVVELQAGVSGEVVVA